MKIFTGTVVSKKMDKTASVSVQRVVKHRLYGKRLKRTKTYHVHDEVGVNVGDVVRFIATKPISKTKRWAIVQPAVQKEESKKTVKKKASVKKSPAKKSTKKTK